jgi:fatty-acyl-CoA synthase
MSSSGVNAQSVTRTWLRAFETTAPIAANPTRILPVLVQELAERFGDAPAMLSERECWSFRQLAARTNQYSRWALDQNIAPGDVVALLMPNRPEYLAIWLGITAVGGVVSLVNTNLFGRSLTHCLDLVKPKHIIVAAELIDTAATALSELEGVVTIWSHGAGHNRFARIEREIEHYSGATLASVERRDVTLNDRALYMYTSGTTGLPKAAVIDHRRLMTWSYWFAGMMNTGPADRMYNCLPLYHSVGGVVATGAVLVNGGSVFVREKFSASQFWNDVTRWDCTIFQYIGELCRYLTNAEPHPQEAAHRIRLCCGNGLRVDVWNEFKTRFRIPQILEFYAATEGNVSLFNVEGKPGAIGRIPSFLVHRFPAALVKFDVSMREPVRNKSGFFIRCAPQEVGLAIGRIGKDLSDAGSRFDGYTSQDETEKKILRDVFAEGDAWFSTGDLMRKDDHGYFYFVDRVGDTFRWKGENVATSEVSEAITALPEVAEANVYGVSIPGTDGRAGMAALVLKGDLDLATFRRHLAERLPAYARPLFVRIKPAMEVTDTFKQTKNGLASEAYNPSIIDDPIYFDDPALQAFVPLDPALYDAIQRGDIRL